MHHRIQIAKDPLLNTERYRFGDSLWPAKWVGPAHYDADTSMALLFRRSFDLPSAKKIRIHISADQRYELSVDGEYVGRGVERSDLRNWVYESYELDLAAGHHDVLVRVWWVAARAPAPEAQMTHRPAFLLYAEGDANPLLSTGVADWEYQQLPGYAFHDHDRLHSYFATGALLAIDGRQISEEVEAGKGQGWAKPAVLSTVALAALRWESNPWWILRPAFLPPAYEKALQVGTVRHIDQPESTDTSNLPVHASANLSAEVDGWSSLLAGTQTLAVPANSIRRVLVDLGNYYCAFPQIICCGESATVRMHFAESLYHVEAGKERNSNSSKGNRDEIDGKCFYGVGFSLTAGTSCHTYQPHLFCAGRYVEIVVQTGANPLTITSLKMLETHFPFSFKAKFSSSDPGHEQIIPVALRTLEMCSHDTSMDCPYYERLNYVGDTRLQSLVAYVSADEERLARKCIELFDLSRQPSGFTSSRYPTRTTQTIPTFSLWWVCMVHDFAMWRDDPGFVRARMPGIRAVLEAWRGQLRDDGLLHGPMGWNFVDWVPTWQGGIPADGNEGASGIINLQAIYTLRRAAELEEHAGETHLAKRHREFAQKLEQNVVKRFFDRKKGLFADDLAHKHYSEHAQCMAILAGTVIGPAAAKLADTMLKTPDVARTTIYFSHYLFEALGATGRIDALLERLELWKSLKTHGFRTTFELPEPSRSDCHAWGAHPVYHFLATIAGIRPATFGFHSLTIRPQLGTLSSIKGTLPHPSGKITFDLRQQAGALTGSITLPKGLKAELLVGKKRQTLKAGMNRAKAPGRPQI